MKSQIFKSEVPIHLLQELLANICKKPVDKQGDKPVEKQCDKPGDKCSEYMVNMESFKKGMYLNLMLPFFQALHPYYFDSKKKYVEKTNITYNSFTTVLRQLCKFHHLAYTSEIKYYKSKYTIEYKICF